MSENWIQPKLYKGIVKSETLMLFEEIPNFKQTDLSQDSVFVLDMGDELFVWVGEDVSELERKAHLVPLKSKFSKNWYVIMTKQGLEPESFKKSFGKWQPELLQKLRNSDDEEKYDALNFNEIDD
ncbi:Villin-1 [Papilio xuthus]|uniref:Villin-1 n=1 Tax=Papilio xuthus TaxID=66420 RepID=A0A0N1IAW2_PAPXU|nr:Villin-1 [Papilio xuthus]